MDKKLVVVPPDSCTDCGACEKSCKKVYPYLSLEEVRTQFLDKLIIKREEEIIPLEKALDRVNSSDIYSKNIIPPSNSAMHDGIAMIWERFEKRMPDTSEWKEGIDYLKVSMGGFIPDKFTTLIHGEKTTISPSGKLILSEIPKENQNIAWKGSRLKEGEQIVPALTTLNPRHLSMLRMGGIEEVTVLKKPKVAIIPTGNDLVEGGSKLKAGQNIESNGILIQSSLEKWGVEPKLYPIVSDNISDLEESIKNVTNGSDIILIIGGVGQSRDDYNDHTTDTIEKIGTVIAHGVLISPGRPVLLGYIGEKPVVGIPGPPHAAIVINDDRPLIKRFLPNSRQNRQMVKVVLMQDFTPRSNSDRFNRVYVKWNGDNYEAYSIERLGDTVDNFINASGVVCYSPKVDKYKKGDLVEVELLYTQEEIRMCNE